MSAAVNIIMNTMIIIMSIIIMNNTMSIITNTIMNSIMNTITMSRPSAKLQSLLPPQCF